MGRFYNGYKRIHRGHVVRKNFSNVVWDKHDVGIGHARLKRFKRRFKSR